jgi:hypothetical protein
MNSGMIHVPIGTSQFIFTKKEGEDGDDGVVDPAAFSLVCS